MKHTLLALAVVLAACSGGSSEVTALRSSERLAIVGTDGNLTTFDWATGVATILTSDAGPGRVYSQPTWSPDGMSLAFVASSAAVTGPGLQVSAPAVRVGLEAQQEVTGDIHIVPAEGGEPTIFRTPFPAFYLYWSPDGGRLAFLGVDRSTSRQGLGIIDTATGIVERIDTGQPYFFAWSPGSDLLLVHAANRELYLLGMDGSKEQVSANPGGFSAPNWVDDARLFPVREGRRQILRLFGLDGAVLRDVTDYATTMAFELNPDEERVAYIDIGPGANPFGLGTLVVDGPGGVTEVADPAAAFFWSADGSRLLYLTPDFSNDDFKLHWNVWDGSRSFTFEPFLPTPTFVQQYLPFFGQYAGSLSFFSPGGNSFTFAGTIDGRGEGIWIQPVEDGEPAQLVASGEFSTWAP